MSTALSCAPLTQGNSTEALCSYQDKQTECYGLKNAVAEAVISAQYDYIYDGDYNSPLFVEGSHSTYTLPTMIVVKKNNKL